MISPIFENRSVLRFADGDGQEFGDRTTGPRDGIIDLNLLSVINLKSNSVKKFDEVREMIVYGELSVAEYDKLVTFVRDNLTRLENKLSNTPQDIALLNEFSQDFGKRRVAILFSPVAFYTFQ